MRPLRVFLCHASQDKPAVRELYNALKGESWIDPWLDKAKILPGQDWEMVIEKAVEDADVVITCLSSQSVTKEGFVQKEIRYAYDIALEKPEETIFLIPLRLDDCVVPRKLKSLHWVDYFGADKDEAYNNLLEALRLRHEQKLKAEELEREKQEQKRHEAEELSRQLAAERAAREKAELEAKTEREAKMKWEQEAGERTEREAKEKAARLKAEQEARERVEREAAEKAAREKLELDALEKVKRQAQNAPRVEPKKEKTIPGPDQKNSLPIALGGLGLLLIVGLCIVGVVMAAKWLSPKATQVPSQAPAATEAPVATQLPAATEAPTTRNMTGDDGMTLLYVPAGNFTMGDKAEDALAECQKYRSDCKLDWFKDEEPPHEVYVDAFWIDQTEVTNKMYAQCVAANKCDPPTDAKSYTHPNYYGNSEFDNYPVIYVNWNMATAYCSWAGRRLPTEAEWEKAASWDESNQTKRIYPWGNSLDCSLANYWGKDNGNSACVGDTMPVGSYESGKSPYGAYDMAGNVREWVSDWYDVYSGGDATASSDFGQKYRVLRGGSWGADSYYVRTADRYRDDPSDFSYYYGFRCARGTSP